MIWKWYIDDQDDEWEKSILKWREWLCIGFVDAFDEESTLYLKIFKFEECS